MTVDISYEVASLRGKFIALIRRQPDGKLLAFSKLWNTRQEAVDCATKIAERAVARAKAHGCAVEELLG